MNFNKKLILLFAILMITTWQCIDIYVPSMPSMVIALHTSAAMIQLSITIALIAYGSVALIYGPLSDYFGRRIIALVGMGIFVAGSALCMFAPNIYVLLIGRVLQGIGFASAGAVAAPALSDIYSGDELVKAYSYVGMSMAVAPVVAPVIGGYLQQYFNWHAPFIFLFLYIATIWVLFYRYFPETKKTLRQGSIHPLEITKNYLSILKNAKYVGYVLCMIFVLTGEIFYVVNAPFLLQNKLGLSPVQNGWAIIVTVGGMLIGSFASNKLCKKFSINQLLFIGGVTSIIGAGAMLLFALFSTLTVTSIVVPMMFYMLGAGMIYPNAIGGCMACFPEKTGAAASLSGMLELLVTGLIATAGVYLQSIDQLALAIILVFTSILATATLKLAK